MLRTTHPLSTTGRCSYRMLISRNIFTLLVLLGINIITAQIHAQDEPAQPNNPPVEAPPLNNLVAAKIFQNTEQWMMANDIPVNINPVFAKDVSGVFITLRFGGQTVGRGEAASITPKNEQAVVDVQKLSAHALAIALKDMTQFMLGGAEKLPDNAIQGGLNINAIAKRLQLDIQFAHSLERLNIARPADIATNFRINAQGLAMQSELGTVWLYPGTTCAENISLQGQVTRLLAKLNLNLQDQAKIGKINGPVIFRFNAIHITRLKANDPITFLYRGGPKLKQVAHQDDELFNLTGRLAAHLIRRQRPNGQFAGTYYPTVDEHKPLTATTYESAAAVYALANASRLQTLLEDDTKQLAAFARRGLYPLFINLGIPAKPADKPAIPPNATIDEISMTLLALLQTPNTGDLKFQRDELFKRMNVMRQPNGLYRSTIRATGREAELISQARAAAALVQMFDRTRDEQYYKQARATLDVIWKKPLDELTMTMPWLAQAEFELSRLDRPSNHLIRLREEVCPSMLKLQVQPDDIGDFPKHHPTETGGFISSNALIKEPTWQSALACSAIARAIRVRDFLNDPQRWRWIVAAGLGTRYLDQLSFHPENTYYVKTPIDALGGVRYSFWDNRLSLLATSHALIATIELQQSIDWIRLEKAKAELENKNKPVPDPEPNPAP